MTEIRFYHLSSQPLEKALPKLLEKVLGKGLRAVVKTISRERVDDLNTLLWTYSSSSFLPHGAQSDGFAQRQPIWLSYTDENPNSAEVLVLTDGVSCDRVSDFTMCLELFDGNNPDSVSRARERWRLYKQDGHQVIYHQQTERGDWKEHHERVS